MAGQIIKGSNRHATTIGNLMRTGQFDRFLATNPSAIIEEMKAYADFLNAATGIGDVKVFGKSVEALNLIFFSPRFVASRVQTPYKLVKYWHIPTVRRAIATDLARFVATGMAVQAIAAMWADDEDETVRVNWTDPRDPDWGKIRIGDTRIDMWGGFQQPLRLVARIGIGALDTIRMATGDEDVDMKRGFYGQGPYELLGRFVSYKFSPAVGLLAELATGETVIGEETTALRSLLRSGTPLIVDEIYEAWRHDGVGKAILTGALAGLGVGVSTYEDSKTKTQARIRTLIKAGEREKATRIARKWNVEHKERKEKVNLRLPRKKRK